jgi:putative NIF3 family GTP cyclohydrolase 1 type 2
MPVKINELINVIESIAPPELAYDWDNSGMQITCSEEISGVLVTLDVTAETVKEAKEKNCDMIVSHHPLFFESVRSIDCEDPVHAVAIELIKNGISVYSGTIKNVAVVGGSGGNFNRAAKDAGAQALVTGEAKHHHFIEAAANGVLLVEAGHFETERYFADEVFMSLQSRVNALQLDVKVIKADSVHPLYEYI